MSSASVGLVWVNVIALVLLLGASAANCESRHFPAGTRDVTIPTQSGIRSDLLTHITPVIEKSIADGAYPGAVILVSHRGHTIYRGVFGNRRIEPNPAAMRYDTIFDIASLTKVLVTAPAIMQLVEQGKLELDAPVAKYWPAFGINGKENITVRELLTHTSGLIPDISDPIHPSTNPSWHGETMALNQIILLKPNSAPNSRFVYSDVNFIILGHLVEILSGKPLNTYAQDNIFKPLKLKNTFYQPAFSLRDRIAPTEIIEKQLRWGKVQDGTANAMGGVAGNAGVFSSAGDLGTFAQCMLDNGRVTHSISKKKSGYLLAPLTVLKMTTPQTPPALVDVRGLGWDIDSVYSNRGLLFPIRSYGHTGWTGTSMWIDPVTQTYLIILTSRTHPTPLAFNQIIHDRRIIADIVAASLTDVSATADANTGSGELTRAYNKLFDKKS
jgi:CubicO group peptidase (beta-lactamase class C family)